MKCIANTLRTQVAAAIARLSPILYLLSEDQGAVLRTAVRREALHRYRNSTKDNKPHFAGPAYIRSGSESVEASEELYNELIATHCSLAGQILKWKDKIITVRVQGKRLGDPRPLNDPGYRPSSYSCRVVACSPVHVELKILGYGDEHVSEPLANVRGDWDIQNQRLCLLIRPAP